MTWMELKDYIRDKAGEVRVVFYQSLSPSYHPGTL